MYVGICLHISFRRISFPLAVSIIRLSYVAGTTLTSQWLHTRLYFLLCQVPYRLGSFHWNLCSLWWFSNPGDFDLAMLLSKHIVSRGLGQEKRGAGGSHTGSLILWLKWHISFPLMVHRPERVTQSHPAGRELGMSGTQAYSVRSRCLCYTEYYNFSHP